MKRNRIAGMLAAGLLLGLFPLQPVHAESNTDRKEELTDIDKKQDEVEQSIAELKKKIKPYRDKTRALEKKIADTDKKLRDVEVQMKKNDKQLKFYESRFKGRVKLMYQKGQMGSMEALMTSESLAQFLERFQTMRLIIMEDRSLFDKYDRVRQEQEGLKKKLLDLKAKQKQEAEKARDLYGKVYKEIQKTERELDELEKKEQSTRDAMERERAKEEIRKISFVDPSLYPYRFSGTSEVDPWGFYKRQCTSYVAWRINQRGVDFENSMRGGRFSNAENWDDNARSIGMTVNQAPAVGAIAQFEPGVSGAGSVGHVAFVKAVNGSTITIEEYNYDPPYQYGERTVSASGVSNYIHVQ